MCVITSAQVLTVFLLITVVLRYLVWFDRGGINRLNPYLARGLIDYFALDEKN